MKRIVSVLLLLLVLCGWFTPRAEAQALVEDDSVVASAIAGVVEEPAKSDEVKSDAPFFSWGNRKTFIGLDFAFLSYTDGSLKAAMGRERQILPARMVISLYGDYNKFVSYRAEINPIDRSMTPRPYVPHEDDRRTYFFPNQPDVVGGLGVASVPEGLFYVDDYKTLGVDPIAQMNGLRVGYVDLHTASRKYGAQVGRVYVPQGLGLDNVTWFSAKDLSHIQIIDAAADNGVVTYFSTKRFKLELAVVTGNGSSFHDYSYSNFTTDGEDKNSAVASISRVTVQVRKGLMFGASVKHNYINSRIEDSTTLQLSKRYDNAFTGFAKWQQSDYLMVYGQVSRYKWGLRDSSAELMPEPRPETPIFKDGYLMGMEVTSPQLPKIRTRVTLGYARSELDRDDSLVAWATANQLFDVRMGKRERSNIFRLQGRVGQNFSLFWFLHDLSNPFPELSAIKPISGPGSENYRSDSKSGFGMMFKF